jgi:hypothetical protein
MPLSKKETQMRAQVRAEHMDIKKGKTEKTATAAKVMKVAFKKLDKATKTAMIKTKLLTLAQIEAKEAEVRLRSCRDEASAAQERYDKAFEDKEASRILNTRKRKSMSGKTR